MPATATTDTVKQIHYLAASLKAPRITEAAARLADQASWMWNMPVTGTSPWVAVGLIATAAGAIAAAWLRRSDRAYLHSRA